MKPKIRKVSTALQKRFEIVDGDYRIFENYFIDERMCSFGFPKENCRDKRVWVGLDTHEQYRVRESIANQVIAGILPLRKITKGALFILRDRAHGKKNKGEQYLKALSRSGFCIRCGVGMAFYYYKPMCKSCHKSWNRFKNKQYTEHFCHSCGENAKVCMENPQCANCDGQ